MSTRKRNHKKLKIKRPRTDDSKILCSNTPTKDNAGILSGVTPRQENLSVSLKYFQGNFVPFHKLDSSELTNFDKFVDELRKVDSWAHLPDRFIPTHGLKCGPKVEKRIKNLGIDCTQNDVIHLKMLSRVSRVHGIRIGSRFKLIFLDPKHKLNKE